MSSFSSIFAPPGCRSSTFLFTLHERYRRQREERDISPSALSYEPSGLLLLFLSFLFFSEDHFGGTALHTESQTNEGQRLSMQANLRATIYDVITISPRQRVHLAFAIIGKLQISLSDGNKRRVSIFQSDETFASVPFPLVSTSILKDQSPPVCRSSIR